MCVCVSVRKKELIVCLCPCVARKKLEQLENGRCDREGSSMGSRSSSSGTSI